MQSNISPAVKAEDNYWEFGMDAIGGTCEMCAENCSLCISDTQCQDLRVLWCLLILFSKTSNAGFACFC